MTCVNDAGTTNEFNMASPYTALADSGKFWLMNMFTVEEVSADRSDTNFNFFSFLGNDFSNVNFKTGYNLACMTS